MNAYHHIFYKIACFGFFLFFTSNLVGQTKQDSIYAFENLSKIYSRLQPEKIIEYASNASPYFLETQNWVNYYKCLAWLTLGNYLIEDFEKGIEASKKSVEIAEKHFGINSEYYSIAISNLAPFYQLKGDYSNAIYYGQKAMTATEKQGDEYGLGNICSNLAYTFQTLGELELALDYSMKAYNSRLAAMGIMDPDLPGYLTFMAKVHKEKNQIETAKSLFHQALSLVEKHPSSKYLTQPALTCYQNLADLYHEQNNFDSTSYYINLALEASKEYTLLDDYKTHVIYGNFFLKEQKYEAALEQFQKAEAAVKKEYESYQRHPEIAKALMWQGKTYLEKGDSRKAVEIINSALKTNTKDYVIESPLKNPDINQYINKAIAIDLLAEKADALYLNYEGNEEGIKELKASYESYQLLTELIKEVRKSYFAQGSKVLLSGKVVRYFEKAIKVALELFEITAEEKYLAEAWRFAESNKALVLLESITEQSAKDLSGIPDSLLKKDKELATNLAFYETKLFEEKQKGEKGETEKVERWEGEVFDLKQEKRKLNEFLVHNYPKYNELKGDFDIVSLPEIQKGLLNSENALIEYFVGEESSYIFCISKDDVRVYNLDTRENFLQSALNFRQLISNKPNSQNFEASLIDFQEVAYQLYQTLLKDCLMDLPENINQLILIPDDILSYLPFEILLTQKPNESVSNFNLESLDYLFERYRLSYGFSGTLLLKKHKKRKSGALKSFLGFAPTFGNDKSTSNRDCVSGEVYDLHCNQPEIKEVNHLLNGDALFGANANLENFKSNASNYEILHLSTHACVNDENPMLNKIFLSDGFLSGYDLTNIALNAKMAVLSACNTGSGKLVKGEGIMSLARGFTLAGCPSTVTTLWSVDDCATSKFIIQFYKHLLQGLPKNEALRKTKYDFLEQADIKQSHPYYWGAFVQFGNTDKVFNTGNKYWWMAFGFLSILILGFFFKSRALANNNLRN